jgi:predicted Co/Zn/Cd cation transporter (cation efflux family)
MYSYDYDNHGIKVKVKSTERLRDVISGGIILICAGLVFVACVIGIILAIIGLVSNLNSLSGFLIVFCSISTLLSVQMFILFLSIQRLIRNQSRADKLEKELSKFKNDDTF